MRTSLSRHLGLWRRGRRGRVPVMTTRSCHNETVRAFAERGEDVRAMKAFRKAINDETFEPDEETFGALIELWTRAKNPSRLRQTIRGLESVPKSHSLEKRIWRAYESLCRLQCERFRQNPTNPERLERGLDALEDFAAYLERSCTPMKARERRQFERRSEGFVARAVDDVVRASMSTVPPRKHEAARALEIGLSRRTRIRTDGRRWLRTLMSYHARVSERPDVAVSAIVHAERLRRDAGQTREKRDGTVDSNDLLRLVYWEMSDWRSSFEELATIRKETRSRSMVDRERRFELLDVSHYVHSLYNLLAHSPRLASEELEETLWSELHLELAFLAKGFDSIDLTESDPTDASHAARATNEACLRAVRRAYNSALWAARTRQDTGRILPTLTLLHNNTKWIEIDDGMRRVLSMIRRDAEPQIANEIRRLVSQHNRMVSENLASSTAFLGPTSCQSETNERVRRHVRRAREVTAETWLREFQGMANRTSSSTTREALVDALGIFGRERRSAKCMVDLMRYQAKRGFEISPRHCTSALTLLSQQTVDETERDQTERTATTLRQLVDDHVDESQLSDQYYSALLELCSTYKWGDLAMDVLESTTTSSSSLRLPRLGQSVMHNVITSQQDRSASPSEIIARVTRVVDLMSASSTSMPTSHTYVRAIGVLSSKAASSSETELVDMTRSMFWRGWKMAMSSRDLVTAHALCTHVLRFCALSRETQLGSLITSLMSSVGLTLTGTDVENAMLLCVERGDTMGTHELWNDVMRRTDLEPTARMLDAVVRVDASSDQTEDLEDFVVNVATTHNIEPLMRTWDYIRQAAIRESERGGSNATLIERLGERLEKGLRETWDRRQRGVVEKWDAQPSTES